MGVAVVQSCTSTDWILENTEVKKKNQLTMLKYLSFHVRKSSMRLTTQHWLQMNIQ